LNIWAAYFLAWTAHQICILLSCGIKNADTINLCHKREKHMPDRVFGDIPDYPEGSFFESRLELSRAGVHRPTMAGISGTGKEGADSIVLSGGYEDDRDLGDVIVYTGHGGRDPQTRQQVSDQLLMGGNLALAYSCIHGLPVRVIRGAGHMSPYSPPAGYRYDGLYRVEDYWHDTGVSRHMIWRFRLAKLTPTRTPADRVSETREPYLSAPRQETTFVRIVRDTQQARAIKTLYDYCCQICDTRLEGSAGPYAEAAHIWPLGVPHNGPDTLDNLLCLCPNHHVLFDYGGFAIADDLTLLGIEGQLKIKPEHIINIEHIRYHRTHYYTRI
jgi:putative restriction endonuclease